ncbi:hypothetical protein QYF56_25245 [Paenibacillus polymyxa]|nr:hypothetical protein [Paenibacillus polymyxa]
MSKGNKNFVVNMDVYYEKNDDVLFLYDGDQAGNMVLYPQDEY